MVTRIRYCSGIVSSNGWESQLSNGSEIATKSVPEREFGKYSEYYSLFVK